MSVHAERSRPHPLLREIAQLRQRALLLQTLLEDPHPGLESWRQEVAKHCRIIGQHMAPPKPALTIAELGGIEQARKLYGDGKTAFAESLLGKAFWALLGVYGARPTNSRRLKE
jgi:hypothetical protein